MPVYKLTYFTLAGLAESIRFLFHHGGIDFEDNRVTFESWPELKPKMPMEQMPILEVDGKVFHQTRAIGRYLAKKVGLYGAANDLEDMEIDATVDDIEDWRTNLFKFYYEEDPAYKEELMKQGDEKSLFYLKKLEERAKKNGGYFVGDKVSWADVFFAAIAEVVNTFFKTYSGPEKCSALKTDNVIQDYHPALTKMYESVHSLPKIKAYLEKRPANTFKS